MKLLLLNYEYPPLGGGAGNATKNIGRELAAAGHEVTVITTWFEGLSHQETSDGMKIYRITSKRKRKDRSSPMEMFDFVRKAKKKARELVQENKPDRIISFFALPTGLVAHDLYTTFGIPYIISLRGGDVPGFLPKELWLMHLLSTPWTNKVWRDAQAIVANSHDLQMLAQKTARKFNKEVKYIPNGVDGAFFEHKEHSNENSVFKILCVGRLVQQKRFDLLIYALAQLVRENKKIELHIVGDGPLKDELEQLAVTEKTQQYVHFHGWLDKNELKKQYRDSDVFVLPSIEEGMPNVVLEAMASGLPIIASNVSGNNELVRNNHNGYFADTIESITEKIKILEHDRSLCTQMGIQSRNKSKDFDWKKVAHEYAILFA
jgi:glycosyltransferase involved in cell wall biosynthesis